MKNIMHIKTITLLSLLTCIHCVNIIGMISPLLCCSYQPIEHQATIENTSVPVQRTSLGQAIKNSCAQPLLEYYVWRKNHGKVERLLRSGITPIINYPYTPDDTFDITHGFPIGRAAKNTVLHRAVKNNDTLMTLILLCGGAQQYVNATDAVGKTPLYIACENNNTVLARLLLAHNAIASLAICDPHYHQLPIDFAYEYHSVVLAEELLRADAPQDLLRYDMIAFVIENETKKNKKNTEKLSKLLFIHGFDEKIFPQKSALAILSNAIKKKSAQARINRIDTVHDIFSAISIIINQSKSNKTRKQIESQAYFTILRALHITSANFLINLPAKEHKKLFALAKKYCCNKAILAQLTTPAIALDCYTLLKKQKYSDCVITYNNT